MGLAASQARLLSLTARIHDVEYQAQMIQSAKLQLALQEDEVYRKYNEALDAQTLTYRNSEGTRVKANFDNLFGASSVKNGMNKYYMLYDKQGDLIVPDDIFEAYQDLAKNDYTCIDPELFAMHMVTGASVEDIQNAEKNFNLDDNNNSKYKMSSTLQALFDQRSEVLKNIKNIIGYDISETSDSTEDIIKKVKDDCNPDGNNPSTLDADKYKTLCEYLDKFAEVNDKYRYQLYNSFGEQICENIAGNNTEFDYDLYNYYLRYAKAIEAEGGLIGVSSANADGGENFSTDAEVLNEMLQSGSLWIDIVAIDKNGDIDSTQTSAASDSNVTFTNSSSIDSTALKQAEAEYEYAMKKIDQKDKKFDMDLNRLETERSALTTEYDSVKKVIQDNIERTFGIFS